LASCPSGISSLEGVSSEGNVVITITGVRLSEFSGGQASFGGVTVPFQQGPAPRNAVPAQFLTARSWYTCFLAVFCPHGVLGSCRANQSVFWRCFIAVFGVWLCRYALETLVLTLPEINQTGYVLLSIELPTASGRRLQASGSSLVFPIYVFYECGDNYMSQLVSVSDDGMPLGILFRGCFGLGKEFTFRLRPPFFFFSSVLRSLQGLRSGLASRVPREVFALVAIGCGHGRLDKSF